MQGSRLLFFPFVKRIEWEKYLITLYYTRQITQVFWKMAIPANLYFIRSFQTIDRIKTDDFSGIRPWIDRVDGKQADPLTTTTAKLLSLYEALRTQTKHSSAYDGSKIDINSIVFFSEGLGHVPGQLDVQPEDWYQLADGDDLRVDFGFQQIEIVKLGCEMCDV